MFLYVTCDRIGSKTGGGVVTANELEALNQLGPVDVINPQPKANPFESEVGVTIQDLNKYKLAHFYSGSFPQLTKKLKEHGIKVIILLFLMMYNFKKMVFHTTFST